MLQIPSQTGFRAPFKQLQKQSQKKFGAIHPFLPFPQPFPLWGFPYMGVPQNGCFVMENPNLKWMMGVPPFMQTPI